MSPENLLEEIYRIRCRIAVSRLVRYRKEKTRLSAKREENGLILRESEIVGALLDEWETSQKNTLEDLRRALTRARKKLLKKASTMEKSSRGKFYRWYIEQILNAVRRETSSEKMEFPETRRRGHLHVVK